MFFPQEYQHVHLLWSKKRSFILVWKPNPPLRSVRGAHLRACADAASINQALLKRSHWKRLSSRDQWNLTPATMCRGSAARCMKQMLWSSADALEQRRPCTRTSATMSNFYSHILKKWSQSRALYMHKNLTDPKRLNGNAWLHNTYRTHKSHGLFFNGDFVSISELNISRSCSLSLYGKEQPGHSAN